MTDLLSDFVSRPEGVRHALEMADKIERTINDWPEEFHASLMNVAACHRMGAEFSVSPKPLTMEEQLRNILEIFPQPKA